MRPLDDLSSLKHLPLVFGATGAFVLPAMWAMVVDKATLLGLSALMGTVFLAAGLYVKYRSTYSPREALWSAPLVVFFFGSLLVGSTSLLAWRAQRPDLQPWAVAVAALIFVISTGTTFLTERRRLRLLDPRNGVPVALVPLLDLKRHRVLPVDSPPPPRAATVAILSAITLNVPLLLQIVGWEANDVIWLAMPVLAAAVTYVLATGIGPAFARAIALRAIERRIGHSLVTSRLEELQSLRRSFWLSRWLGRPDIDKASTHRPSPKRNEARRR